ncbi:putative palmitoyl protein thioesterase [Diplodia seriata]|uniref:Palmitoyl-protein thioesterase 1 n=1 Tax=Diplodia seriata TaxID=420778 RepID=A0A0G2FQ45_9PEZI|nr:putative palmitoyl protein thioesterase [Diplodia seriata]
MRPTTLAAFLTLLSPSTALPTTSSDPLPLVIWHGLGDNYLAEGLQEVGELAEKVHPGTFVYNVRLDNDAGSDRTATFFGNVTTQLEQVCEDLAAHPILSSAPAIDALGFSQGGQFLRGYIERCNKPPVRSLVTFGSQHNGIAKFQACGPTDWLCKGAMGLLRSNAWSGFVQNRVVPAQYYRELNESTGLGSDNYLEHSNFLADINNERALKNETYKKNLASLEKFVMFVFADDTTVIPKETGWFAEVNATSEEVTKIQDRTIYKEDWIGLKQLDEKGALIFKNTPGEHMRLDEDDLEDAFREYFGPVSKKSVFQEVLVDWEL